MGHPLPRTHETLWVMTLACLAMLLPAMMLHAQSAAESKAQVRVAVLTYANGQTSKCFASGFLETVARHTRIDVQREFSKAVLREGSLHEHPFLIMTGEGAFTLSDDEKQILKNYLQRGGFLLASAGCSNEDWANSFRAVFKELFPEDAMTELPMSHPLFRSIHPIDSLPGRKANTSGKLEGLALGGRLAVVFSAMGLNDTENAGGGCCCCGGNELRDAHRINANILAYVLTH